MSALKQKSLLIISILILFAIFMFISTSWKPLSQIDLPKGTLTIGSTKINVEIAGTDQSRSLGLSDRASLAENSGMLFKFDSSGRHSFWMKGMKFALDFIWISQGKVVDLTENAPVENKDDASLTNYQPKEEVNQVLEVNAGFVKKHKIEIGQEIREN